MTDISLNKRIHEDCSEQEAFWINYGPIIKNLPQLIDVLKHMKNETFHYHVNEDHNKNDFADWIRSALKDRKLALKLEGIMDQKEYIQIIIEHVEELKEKGII